MVFKVCFGGSQSEGVVGRCSDLSLKGSGTITRYSFIGVGVVLLEEVCHCGGGL